MILQLDAFAAGPKNFVRLSLVAFPSKGGMFRAPFLLFYCVESATQSPFFPSPECFDLSRNSPSPHAACPVDFAGVQSLPC